MDGVDHSTHADAAAGVSVVFGGSRFLKKIILDYCFSHFDEEQIWLVDSLQVFDPYYLSSVNVSRTRSMLYSIRVSRPFTFYQLHDKIMNLTRIPLDARSTIIISGMDCFIDEARMEKERTAMMGRMIGVLAKLRGEKRCAVILGVRSNESRQMLSSCFPDMQVWQESGAIERWISGEEFMQLLERYAPDSIHATKHALFRLNEQQRKIFEDAIIKELILGSAPLLVGIQRNGTYAVFYKYRRDILKAILDIQPVHIHIITFYIINNQQLPKAP